MTIRPADVLTMLPRLGEAGKIQHHQEMRTQVAAQGQRAQTQQRAEQELRQVNRGGRPEQAAVSKDGGRRGGGGQQQPQKREQAPKPVKEAEQKTGGGRRLDIKL